MYCNPIRQSYNSKHPITKLCHLSPEANSGVALNFNTDWVLNNLNAPLTLDVWTLTQDFILKISSELVVCMA